MRQVLNFLALSFSLVSCATPPPYDFHRAPASVKTIPSLTIDGKAVNTDKTNAMIWGNPVEAFRGTNVELNGKSLQPFVLKRGEHLFVHSNRYFWSPRQSGQAFFDTFLFGCESLPPSPLDRVVTEGLRMKVGESALIEEYPDRAATIGTQAVAQITCAD